MKKIATWSASLQLGRQKHSIFLKIINGRMKLGRREKDKNVHKNFLIIQNVK